MSTPYRIILCGQSIFLMSIEAGLAALPEVEVIRVSSYLSAIAERIEARQPNLVVLERNSDSSDLALALLSRSLPVVELHPQTEQVTFLTGRQLQISRPEDMVELIEQIK